MTNSTIDESQRKAARVVGFTYLLAMVAAIFEFSVRARLIGPPNGAVNVGDLVHAVVADNVEIPSYDEEVTHS